MRRLGVAAMVGLGLVGAPVAAQVPRAPGPGRPVRVVLTSGRLASVVDAPLHFKLLRVTLAGGQPADFTGPNGMLYVVSGALEGSVDGERRTFREGSAVFLPGGQRVGLAAAPGAAAVLLHFLLVPATELGGAPWGQLATVTELFQTPRPIPGLKSGPYEFGMTRVSVDKGVPRPPLHHRSGAALYFVLAGNWTLHQEGAAEPRARGAVQFEPYDFVHTWENTGETTGVLLQANISPEGAPEIVFLPPR